MLPFVFKLPIVAALAWAGHGDDVGTGDPPPIPPMGLVSPTRPAMVRVVGVGYPPRGKAAVQARLLARRAAEANAMKALAGELRLPPRAKLRGFRVVSRRERPDGSVVVVLEAPR